MFSIEQFPKVLTGIDQGQQSRLKDEIRVSHPQFANNTILLLKEESKVLLMFFLFLDSLR